MHPTASSDLDLRTLPPEARPDALLGRFDPLPEQGSVVLLSDVDPRPLFDVLEDRRKGRFLWIDQGPERGVTRVEVIRLRPKETETGVNEFYSRDHDEIDVYLNYVRRELALAVENRRAPAAWAVEYFDIFDRRLSLHIRWEEEILFPAVESKDRQLESGPGRVLRWEHREILNARDRVSVGLHGDLSAPGRVQQAAWDLESLINVLVPHNHKEENIYYPLSDQVFTPAEQSDILGRTRATG